MIWWVVVLVVSAIPLNIAVKLLGGRSSLLKVVAINLLMGLVNGFLDAKLRIYSGIASFIILLLLYRFMFDIGWIRAILAWVLQFVLVAAFMIALMLLGVNVLSF